MPLRPQHNTITPHHTTKPRLPFLVGNTLLVLGNLLYFLAIKFVVEEEGASSSTSSGIYVALLARCIYGMGAASGSISFTYIGAVFDHDDLTAASNYLSFGTFRAATLRSETLLFL